MGRSRRLVRRFLPASLAAVAVLTVGPSGVSAATQIGQTFAPTGGSPVGFTWLPSGAPEYWAPSAGVITSWSFQAGASPPQIKFKVGRPASGADFTMAADFTIIGESASVIPAASSLNTYPIQIPVQVGDMIGLYGVSGGGDWGRVVADYTYHVVPADPPVGTTETFTPSGNFQFDLSAVLEPDCDKDGLGDETQDADLSSCHSNAFTFAGVTRNKKKGTATLKVKVPEPGQLTGSGNGAKVAAAGATTSKAVTPGIAKLLIKAKGKKKRKLNQTGKVKLSVAVTYTPTGGKPNTQTVKVKLKKNL